MSANPVVDFNWFGATRSNSPLWYTNGRLDHRFSEKDQVHASVQWTMSSTLYPTTAGGVGQPMLNGVAGLEFDSNQSMSLAPTWLHTFSPTFFNEFIIAGKRNVWFGGEVEGGNWPDKFGLPNPFNSGRWPQITDLGMGNFGYVTNDTKMNHENVVCPGRQPDQGRGQARDAVRLPRPPRLSEYPGPAEIAVAPAELRHRRDGPVRRRQLDPVQPCDHAADRDQHGQHVPGVFQLPGPTGAQLVLPDGYGDGAVFSGQHQGDFAPDASTWDCGGSDGRRITRRTAPTSGSPRKTMPWC